MSHTLSFFVVLTFPIHCLVSDEDSLIFLYGENGEKEEFE